MRYFGVDWYPEQWGMDHVDEDLDMIKELGANLIRIGDFAWDRFEPEEGRYDFTFFDEVIERAKKMTNGHDDLMDVQGSSGDNERFRDWLRSAFRCKKRILSQFRFLQEEGNGACICHGPSL